MKLPLIVAEPVRHDLARALLVRHSAEIIKLLGCCLELVGRVVAWATAGEPILIMVSIHLYSITIQSL